MTFQEEREAVCRVGRLLYDRGYVAANDGNISVKVAENRLLITPSGVSKGRMTPEMLLVTDMDGTVIEGDRHPSSEGKMHLEVYRGRPDVNAVVHAHPPVSTAFAVCRRGLETPYLSELVVGLGQVPCTPSFAMLSTEEVPESVRPIWRSIMPCCWQTTARWPGAAICGKPLTAWKRWSIRQKSCGTSSSWAAVSR